MKGAVLFLLAICEITFGSYISNEYELERLRKFLTRQLSNEVDQPECSAPVDVVFIMDRSRSIWGPNFEKEKEFVQEVVKMFDPKFARFGVITWAEGAETMIKLGAHGSDQTALLRDIGAITQRPEIGGSTETWAALRLLRQDVMRPRPEAKPIAVLITDGASQDKELTATEAAEVHKAGITVFAVGIREAEMDPNELRAIASDPDADHLFMLDNWEQATEKLKEIGSAVCPSNIDGCKHNRPMDLVFSMSARASGAATAYAFDLVEAVLGKVTLGQGQVQVGLAPRTCASTWAQIALNAHDTADAFIEAIQTREFSLRNSLKDRFTYLTRKAFSAENGAQTGSDVEKVAVVIIDNRDDIASVVAAASGLRRDGVKLLVIAVGDVSASDVGALTDANNVIHVDSYPQMATIHAKLLAKLCDVQKLSP